MKQIILLLLLFCVSAIEPFQYKVYQDSLLCDRIGYNNCDIKTNGETDLISHFIKMGSTVFDVGAATGEWSLLVLSKHPQVSLYAFEPIPESFNQLFQKTKNYNLMCFNFAFSNVKGEKNIAWYNNSLGWAELSSFYRREEVEKNCQVTPSMLKVITYDLDTFCQEHLIDTIDFLKIDTEGSELDIFKGAQRLLATQKIKYIQFEYGGTYLDAKTTLKEVFQLLQANNYLVFRIIPNALIQINNWRDALETYNYSNYFACVDTTP